MPKYEYLKWRVLRLFDSSKWLTFDVHVFDMAISRQIEMTINIFDSVLIAVLLFKQPQPKYSKCFSEVATDK